MSKMCPFLGVSHCVFPRLVSCNGQGVVCDTGLVQGLRVLCRSGSGFGLGLGIGLGRDMANLIGIPWSRSRPQAYADVVFVDH